MSRPKPASSRTGHNSQVQTITRSPLGIETPDAPDQLGQWGSELWHLIWGLGTGVYQHTDYWVVERWCSLQERRRELLAVISQEGLLSTGSTGQPVVHPGLKMVDQIEGRLPNLEAALGLTPESRLRLGIAAVDASNKLDLFLAEEGGHTTTA
jgi:P27 family predicted phage terminase small subunit